MKVGGSCSVTVVVHACSFPHRCEAYSISLRGRNHPKSTENHPKSTETERQIRESNGPSLGTSATQPGNAEKITRHLDLLSV